MLIGGRNRVQVASRETSFQLGYRPCLDGLRALSILSVMAFHAKLEMARGGFLGVDVFFVLSGFLITSLLTQEWADNGKISIKDFYKRRMLRLLPALLAFLLVCGLDAILFEPKAYAIATFRGILFTLSYLANWGHIFQWWGGHPLIITWSLAIEEQFYLVWPPLLWLMLRAKTQRKWIIRLLLAAIFLSFGLRALFWHHGVSHIRLYYGSDMRADSLLIGCMLGLLASWGMLPHSLLFQRILRILAVFSVLLLAIMVVTSSLKSSYLYYGGFTVAALGVATILTYLLTTPKTLLLTVLEWPLMVWIGRISYGLYLWHAVGYMWTDRLQSALAPVILPAAIKLIIRVALTFALASLSFYYIEKPFLSLKGRIRKRDLGKAKRTLLKNNPQDIPVPIP